VDVMMLSKRIEQVKPSATLAITSKAKALKQQGVNIISFGAGEPDFDTPTHIKEAAIKAAKDGFTKYTPAAGTKELKDAVCKKFKSDNNLTYEASQIVISCGAKHSLYNVFQVMFNEGDEIILPAPYWVSYFEMANLCGAHAVAVPTTQDSEYKVTGKLLRKALTKKTKAILLNSPSNPSGTVYTKEELEIISKFALENNLYVISDEIYEKLLYDGLKHESIASLNKDIFEKTVVINGPSKSYSMTGWRIGYLAATKEIAGAVGRLQSHSTSNPTSISQVATLAAIEGDQSCVSMMVAEFEKRRNLIIEELGKIDGISFFKPRGAFYVFCDISKLGLSAAEFADKLLNDVNVACIPGEAFGFSTHIRLSFAISPDDIIEGIGRISKWVKEL